MALQYQQDITLSDGQTTVSIFASDGDWLKLSIVSGGQSLGLGLSSADARAIISLLDALNRAKLVDSQVAKKA